MVTFPHGGAASVYRDFKEAGNPVSDEYEPQKNEIRDLLALYEQLINALLAATGDPDAIALILAAFANKADKTITITGAGVLNGQGGSLAANRVFTLTPATHGEIDARTANKLPDAEGMGYALDGRVGPLETTVNQLRSLGEVKSTADPGGFYLGDKNSAGDSGNWVFGVEGLTGITYCTLGKDSVVYGSFQTETAGARIRELAAQADAGIYDVETIGGKTQIVRFDGAGTKTVVSDTSTVNDGAPQIVGSSLRFWSDRSDGVESATKRAYRALPNGKSVTRSSASKRAIILVGMGQSLMAGTSVSAVITAPRQLGMSLMFNAGEALGRTFAGTSAQQAADVVQTGNIDRLVPYYATPRETILGGLSLRLAKDHGVHTVAINVGIAGASYGLIRKGNAAYNNWIVAATKAVDDLRKQGYEPEIHFLLQHGEQDAASSRVSYRDFLDTHYLNCSVDAKAITGQSDVHLFLCPSPSTPLSQVLYAMWDKSKAEANVHMCGPILGNWFQDTQHPTGVGYNIIGDTIYFRAIKRVLIDGAAWKPLQPLSCSWYSSTELDVVFEGNTGNLVYSATTDVPAIANWGFEYTDDTSPPGITGVAIADAAAAKVRVTFAAAPTGGAASRLLRVGGWTAPGSLPSPSGAYRTNVADSDTLTATYDGRTIPKYAVPSYLAVP